MSTQQTDRFNAERYSAEAEECSTFSSCLQQPRQTLENAVEKRPMTTVLALFGIGLGVGAAIGGMIACQSTSRSRQMENWRERMMDSMSGAVPDSVKHYFKG